MPEWSAKDRRKYEHIKESSEKRGVPTDRAKEIAGRTVNKGRREAGETPKKTTMGTGNPNLPLEERKVDELRNIASNLNVHGRSEMRKDELIQAIRRKR